MEDLKENKKLFRYLMIMFGIAAAAIFDASDMVREYLELVPFPNFEFQYTVIGALAVDLAICYTVEKTLKKMYLATFHKK